MHVILEGPDGAGKTTLADRLVRELSDQHGSAAYHHEGPPPEGADSLLEHYGRQLAEATRPTVFDRFHLGEVVYGPLLRGGARLSPYDLRLLNRLITGTGTQMVLCLPSWSACLKANRCKEEMIKDESLLEIAYRCWEAMLSQDFLANPLFYNYTMQPNFHLTTVPHCPAGVIGSPSAKFLFVGEQPNGSLDLPFFSAKGSSRFLNDAIAEAGLEEEDIAFTNAVDAQGNARSLRDITEQMSTLRHVIPLGKVALNSLNCVQLPITSIPHPAYWKRFHAPQADLYPGMIRKVLDVS